MNRYKAFLAMKKPFLTRMAMRGVIVGGGVLLVEAIADEKLDVSKALKSAAAFSALDFIFGSLKI